MNNLLCTTALSDAFMAEGQGVYRTIRTVTANDIIEAAKTLLGQRCQRITRIADHQDAQDFFITQLSGFDYEVFAVAFLDVRHRVIAFEPMFRGTIHSATVWPREVAKRALEWNAARIIIGHNHPSGETTPSESDKQLTQQLKNALSLLDILLLDHVVVGGAQAVCFSALGLL
jgi:DNA repair protein RadC